MQRRLPDDHIQPRCEPDTYVNFELEAPFMGSCEVFDIPTTDTDCDENEGRTMSKYRHRGYNSNVKSLCQNV